MSKIPQTWEDYDKKRAEHNNQHQVIIMEHNTPPAKRQATSTTKIGRTSGSSDDTKNVPTKVTPDTGNSVSKLGSTTRNVFELNSTQEERDFQLAWLEQIKEEEIVLHKSPTTLKDAIPSFTPIVETSSKLDEDSEEELNSSKGNVPGNKQNVRSNMCYDCGRDRTYCQEVLFGSHCVQSVLDYVEDCKKEQTSLDNGRMLKVYYNTFKVLYKNNLLNCFNMYETNYAINIPECMRKGSLMFCKNEIKHNNKKCEYESQRFAGVEEILTCSYNEEGRSEQ